MFRDVRDPMLIERTAGELALDKVVTRGCALDPLHLRRTGSPATPALCMRIPIKLTLTTMPRPLVSSARHPPQSSGLGPSSSRVA